MWYLDTKVCTLDMLQTLTFLKDKIKTWGCRTKEDRVEIECTFLRLQGDYVCLRSVQALCLLECSHKSTPSGAGVRCEIIQQNSYFCLVGNGLAAPHAEPTKGNRFEVMIMVADNPGLALIGGEQRLCDT